MRHVQFAQVALLTGALAVGAATAVQSQQPEFPSQRPDERLLRRWVGAQVNGLPMWLDFYSDTLLVVSVRSGVTYEMPVEYSVAPRTLTVRGDTLIMRLLAVAFNPNRAREDFSFQREYQMRYRFSLDRMLLEADGTTITMSPQDILARPLEASWIADLPDGRQVDLYMDRLGNAWYRVGGGPRHRGEWDRANRVMSFDWNADSLPNEERDSTLMWYGQYDAEGQQIVLENVLGTSVTIFRRIVR